MKRVTLDARLNRIIKEAENNGGFDNSLRKSELDRGYRLADINDIWLNHNEWENYVIGVNGKIVRIVILLSKKRWNGAFKRLLENIIKADLKIEIISPMFDMPLILQWWGWKSHTRGIGFKNTENYWTPTKEWINKIKVKS